MRSRGRGDNERVNIGDQLRKVVKRAALKSARQCGGFFRIRIEDADKRSLRVRGVFRRMIAAKHASAGDAYPNLIGHMHTRQIGENAASQTQDI